MTPDPEKARIITGWLADLGQITRSNPDLKPTKTRIAEYASQLAEDLPSSAFTSASLKAVATEWFPPLVEVREKLKAWWEEHRPKHNPADRGDSDDPVYRELSHLDKLWVQYWFKRKSENFGAPKEGADPSNAENCASVIRQESPEAWAYIAAKDERGQRVVSDAERMAAAAELSRLAGELTMRGPSGATHDRVVMPRPARNAGLTAEQLEILRSANPNVVNARMAAAASAKPQPEPEPEEADPWSWSR